MSAHRLSMLAVFAALAICTAGAAAILARADREVVTRRVTWCMGPEQRAGIEGGARP